MTKEEFIKRLEEVGFMETISYSWNDIVITSIKDHDYFSIRKSGNIYINIEKMSIDKAIKLIDFLIELEKE